MELPCPCNGMVHVRRHNGPLAPRQAWGRRTRVRFFKAGVVVGAETWRSETNSIEASHREIYSRGWQQTMATTPSRIAKNDGNKFRGRHQPRSQNPAGGTNRGAKIPREAPNRGTKIPQRPKKSAEIGTKPSAACKIRHALRRRHEPRERPASSTSRSQSSRGSALSPPFRRTKPRDPTLPGRRASSTVEDVRQVGRRDREEPTAET